MIFHMTINIFTAVKYCCILHRRGCVMMAILTWKEGEHRYEDLRKKGEHHYQDVQKISAEQYNNAVQV